MGIFTMAETGPITKQPERGEIRVPGPSGNRDGKWAGSLCPCANEDKLEACCKSFWWTPCTIVDVVDYAGKNACLGFFCYPFYAPFLRQAIREKHGIDGNLANDCLWSCGCPFCVLVQMKAETMKGTIEK